MPGGYDPTGLVKGWAVDRALRTLDQAGMPAALVNGGGDLAAFGRPGPAECWRAGIRHPWRADAAWPRSSRCTARWPPQPSYERGAHLVDPRTGQPGGQAASATVTGPSLALADALATAPGRGRGRRPGGDRRAARLPGVPDPAGRQRGVHPGAWPFAAADGAGPEPARNDDGRHMVVSRGSASAADAAAVQRGSRSHMTVQHEGRARPRRRHPDRHRGDQGGRSPGAGRP